MFSAFRGALASTLVSAFVFCTLTAAVHADERAWRVEKSTGEVWVSHGAAQQVSLGAETDLTAGDNIRTGRNGRVLLVRGEERILISPNSAIGIPRNNGQFPTTISQQAGSILLEVEKKNVQHFEVETPYLAAVVKGTQFRVSVDRRGAKVDVLRGQVQVADFKSGQNALVLPGQAARVVAHGQGGLFLSGKGQLNPIERGAPRTPSVQALAVPKGGLGAPRNSPDMSRHAMDSDKASHAFAKETAVHKISNGGVRIGTALGELKLDVHKVTKGLAHSSSDRVATSPKGGPSGQKGAASIGSDVLGGVASASSYSAGSDGSNGVANGSGSANGAGNGSAASASGNGNGGNGNGNGNGNAGGNGNGKAKGK